jgi:hypothetical protein
MAHPINSVATTWITGRLELLCGFFMLLTVVNYHFFLNTLSPRKRIYLVFSLFTCFFALTSKEHALTLPALILAYDIWHSPRCSLKNRMKRILPFFVLFGLFIILRYLVLKETFWAACADYSLLDYRYVFGNILRAVKIGVFPVQAVMSRISCVYSLFFFIVLISVLPVLFKDKKIIFSYLWFFVTFGSLYKFYSFPSPNLYIQSIAFCLFIPFAAEFYAGLFFKNKKGLKIAALAGTVFLLLSMYAVITVKRNTYAQRAAEASDNFIKGVLKLYPEYPAGSAFYFINVPYLVAENQIYGGSELVASGLSLHYGIYGKSIPAYAFTFMLGTSNADDEILVEVKDSRTLIVSSKGPYLNYRIGELGSEHAMAEEIDSNIDTREGFITSKKMRLKLKKETMKLPEKHFFYFSNGIIHELKGLG